MLRRSSSCSSVSRTSIRMRSYHSVCDSPDLCSPQRSSLRSRHQPSPTPRSFIGGRPRQPTSCRQRIRHRRRIRDRRLRVRVPRTHQRMWPKARRRCEPAWATCCCRRRSIHGFQPYFTTGGGRLPRGVWVRSRKRTVGVNTRRRREDLAGWAASRPRGLPRVQTQRATRCYATVHRFYAGLNINF